MAGGSSDGRSYGNLSGFIFVFNLVVGVGALALPQSFQKTGIVLGILFLLVIACLAYISLTFVIEAMACSNAILLLQEPAETQASDEFGKEKPSVFEIRKRVELGKMAELFLGKRGRLFFYFVMIIYLYGDLAIYGVSVPVTLRDYTGSFSIGSWHIGNPYYLYLVLFIIFVSPMCFMNFQGTAWFQYLTMATRNSAFFIMIVIGFVRIGQGDGAPVSDVKVFDLNGLPTLFGTAVYAFMCHHSLPSIVTPIRNKSILQKLFLADYSAIFVAYVTLCLSALFAYGNVTADKCHANTGEPCKIQSLYTLNFTSYSVKVLSGFLTLFPVFTLTSNFPLIAITLRNNLKTLYESIYTPDPEAAERDAALLASGSLRDRARAFFGKHIFGLVTIVPAFGIAFATDDVGALVSFTGSFAGLFIQFVIPASLVFFARRDPRLTRPVLNSPADGPFPVYSGYVDGAASVDGARGSYQRLVEARDPEDPNTRSLATASDSGDAAVVAAPLLADASAVNRDDKDWMPNPYASPFYHIRWIYMIWAFSVCAFVMTCYNQIHKFATS